MAELTRSYDGPVIGRGGVIIIGLILVVLVSLFFIPEIIEFQKSFSGSSSTEKRAETKPAVAKELADIDEPKSEALHEIPAAPEPSSLDQLSMFLDKKSGALRETTESAPDETRASMGTAAKAPKAAKSATQPRNGQSNWDRIRSGESRDALAKARKSALEISRKVPERHAGTRYALFNFANGIDFVLERGPQTLTAGEATSYINSLDQAVTHAMNRESVDRSLQLMWVKLDFGPAISQGGERVQIAPFNPNLSLTWIKAQKSRVRGNPAGLMHIKGGGSVRGGDIDRVELVNNYGTVLRKLPITKPTKNGGYRLFQFGATGNEPFTIRIHDKSGKVYQKTYDFFQGAHEFPMASPQHFRIPYRMSFASSARFAPENVDPRLDAHFLVRVWRGQGDQIRFATMNSNNGGGLADSAAGQLFSTF